MENEEALAVRCKRVKDSLHSLASVLLDEGQRPITPVPKPVEEVRLGSMQSNSEIEDLRQALELEKGRSQRFEELLRSQEASNGQLTDMMKELYETIEQLKREKEQGRAGEEGWRRQVAAFQATITQKERLLSQVESERMQLITEVNALKQQLTHSVSSVSVQENEVMREQVRSLKNENERLLREVRALGNEGNKAQDLSQEVSQLREEREKLIKTVETLETELRELQEHSWEPTKSTLLSNITDVLGLRSPDGILLALESLLSAHQRAVSAISLTEKLSKLIQDCAPEAATPQSPSPKQIWRWVRRLVEEYMTLKRKTARKSS